MANSVEENYKIEIRGDWAAVRWQGELADLETYMSFSDYLAKLPAKAAESAKVFQGTDNGMVATYLVYRQ